MNSLLKNFTNSHRALTSASLSTFELNLNKDYESGLFTSVPDLKNSLLDEWTHIPIETLILQRVEAVIAKM